MFFFLSCFILKNGVESSGAELVAINPLSSVKDTGYKMSPHFRPVSSSAALTSERLSRGEKSKHQVSLEAGL